MAQVAVIKGNDGSEVILSEVRESFAEWTSSVQYIAQCTGCGWQEPHVVLHALVNTAGAHAATHTTATR
ncbi:hypothetical protein GU243_02400 [Pseudarthrobacter psychrotolerans]|uniref:Uncharacterized protein n=1 Tax=Pseudarthrobacter psychrotolerans TaxID=2697569 RepID=A0A6P1NK02_9MICC|nr:hypothetical protein [Pseudarthrobacter psychrotolerans]QHK18814.1 hypothetical protein GU243_02400 [Pseudarthrobacter psychrotolerans]